MANPANVMNPNFQISRCGFGRSRSFNLQQTTGIEAIRGIEAYLCYRMSLKSNEYSLEAQDSKGRGPFIPQVYLMILVRRVNALAASRPALFLNYDELSEGQKKAEEEYWEYALLLNRITKIIPEQVARAAAAHQRAERADKLNPLPQPFQWFNWLDYWTRKANDPQVPEKLRAYAETLLDCDEQIMDHLLDTFGGDLDTWTFEWLQYLSKRNKSLAAATPRDKKAKAYLKDAEYV